MNEFLAAVAKLLVGCGESASRLRHVDGDMSYGDHLAEAAEVVAGLLPKAMDRTAADKAAVLLLSVGGKVAVDGAYLDDWNAAEKQALQLLGVVPLTTAAK